MASVVPVTRISQDHSAKKVSQLPNFMLIHKWTSIDRFQVKLVMKDYGIQGTDTKISRMIIDKQRKRQKQKLGQEACNMNYQNSK